MRFQESDPEKQRAQFKGLCEGLAAFSKRELSKHDKRVSRTGAVDIALARLVVDQEECLRCVQRLHDLHFTIQTHMVLRHMYENYVNAIAIAFPIDPKWNRKTIATLFIKFGALKKWRHIEALRKAAPALVSKDEARSDRAREREAMRYYRLKLKKPGLSKHPRYWHPWGSFAGLYKQVRHALDQGLVPKSVFDDVDRWDWNHTLYQYMSSSVHSDWTSLTAKVDWSKSNPPVLAIATDIDWSSLYFNAVPYYVDTLQCFASHKRIVRRLEKDLLRYF